MSTSIQNQNFGVEIELTGITRAAAAATIAEYFGNTSRHIGTSYDTYGARDRKGRTCKEMQRINSKRAERARGKKLKENRILEKVYFCVVWENLLEQKKIKK